MSDIDGYLGVTKLNRSSDYFDWQWWRLAFAAGAYWRSIKFAGSGDEYRRIAFGLYWRL